MHSLRCLQITLADILPNDLIREVIELFGAELRHLLSAVYLCGRYIMFSPVTAVVAVVKHQWLQVIHGMGVSGFRRIVFFKLIK